LGNVVAGEHQLETPHSTVSMSEHPEQDPRIDEIWRTYMTTGRAPDYVPQPWYQSPVLKRFVRQVPDDPRCHYCHYPFAGIGGKLAKAVLGIERSRLNPHMCNICERFAEAYQGGTEMEMSLLFADVRGSTGLAEKMSAYEFSQLIDRFYGAATHAIFSAGGMVEKLVGDEVTAFFVPAFAGPNHAQVAVEVGRDIVQATGHTKTGQPWVPVGVGIHTGVAYVGTVGQKGANLDIVVLGDNVNVAARLAGVAGAGEIVISETVRAVAGLDSAGMEHRWFDLKGKGEPVEGWISRIG
jgi:adenylate cyclase